MNIYPLLPLHCLYAISIVLEDSPVDNMKADHGRVHFDAIRYNEVVLKLSALIKTHQEKISN